MAIDEKRVRNVFGNDLLLLAFKLTEVINKIDALSLGTGIGLNNP